jgi:hypothetical protein
VAILRANPIQVFGYSNVSTKVTVDVTHRITGDIAISAPPIDVVKIRRIDKSIDYILKSACVECGGYGCRVHHSA